MLAASTVTSPSAMVDVALGDAAGRVAHMAHAADDAAREQRRDAEPDPAAISPTARPDAEELERLVGQFKLARA